MSLHADIAGLAASVDLRATFYNGSYSPLEATYVFPLPELGSVTSLQIWTGTTVIDGWLLSEQKLVTNTQPVFSIKTRPPFSNRNVRTSSPSGWARSRQGNVSASG